MTTEQRLERLERENKWMRRIGVVGVAVAAAVLLIGQGKDKELPDLVVQSLTVKDGVGNVCAELGRSVHGNVLCLYDSDGKARVWLDVERDGSTGLLLANKDGTVRATLGTHPDGSPFLRLSDPRGKQRALLGVTTTYDRTGAEGMAAENTLTLSDAKGKVIWQGPRIDPKGNVVWQAPR